MFCPIGHDKATGQLHNIMGGGAFVSQHPHQISEVTAIGKYYGDAHSTICWQMNPDVSAYNKMAT